MRLIDTRDCYAPIRLHLVDGYLARREILEQCAEAELLPGPHDRLPFSWEGYDLDSIYETLAFRVRQNYCKRLPQKERAPGWCEAWLLKPEEWPAELQLEAETPGEDRRRLLVTLHMGCPSGVKCVRTLVRTSRIEVIPREAYRDYKGFEHKMSQLADDVSLPFRAPCMVAGEWMKMHGYDYRTFGR